MNNGDIFKDINERQEDFNFNKENPFKVFSNDKNLSNSNNDESLKINKMFKYIKKEESKNTDSIFIEDLKYYIDLKKNKEFRNIEESKTVLCSIYINALKRHVESFDIDYFGDIEDFSYKSQIKKNTINKIRYLNRYVKIFIANLYAGNKTLAEQYLNYVKGVFNAVLSLSKRNGININDNSFKNVNKIIKTLSDKYIEIFKE